MFIKSLLRACLVFVACAAITYGDAPRYHTPVVPRYDSPFGASVYGVVGIHSPSSDTPKNLFGGLIGLHNSISSGAVFHQISLTSGVMGSRATNHHYSSGAQTLTDSVKYTTVVPLWAGYTLNLPIAEDSVYFFAGGKLGVTWFTEKRHFGDHPSANTEGSACRLTGTGTAGLRFCLGNGTDLILGYELMKMNKVKPYHLIQAGFNWSF